MATPINTILDWFKTGLKPTQAQFWASWASFWHKDETIPQSSISNLTSVLNAKTENSQFNAHKTDENAHPQLLKIARIIPFGELLVLKTNPDGDQKKKEIGDYCIGFVQDSIVNGNWNGGDENLKSSYE